jgi:MFS family permease
MHADPIEAADDAVQPRVVGHGLYRIAQRRQEALATRRCVISDSDSFGVNCGPTDTGRVSSVRRRILLFGILYASEGAPIGFIWWALPTMLRSADVPVDRITSLTAVVLLPWVLKFLWAPLVDLLRGPRWGYRAWIISMQTVMAASLLPLIWIDPVEGFAWWGSLLLAHAVAAATQDVAIDALAIGAVQPDSRGELNGAMQAGMLTGRSVFGGGVLLMGTWIGMAGVVAALVLWILVATTAALGLRQNEPPPSSGSSFAGALAAAARMRTTWIGLAFALVSAAAFEATGQLAGPYLVDRHVPETTIGVFFGLVVVTAMLTGGLTGGAAADRFGRLETVASALLGFTACILGLAGADARGEVGPAVLIALLAAMYFFVGAFTAASYALFMDLTDPRLGATQFSAFMAATNACESWSAWGGGRLAAASGYPAAFAMMSLVSLASLLLLPLIRRLSRGH